MSKNKKIRHFIDFFINKIIQGSFDFSRIA
jgi:hypothetical protein